jgi:hypothetical protein
MRAIRKSSAAAHCAIRVRWKVERDQQHDVTATVTTSSWNRDRSI